MDDIALYYDPRNAPFAAWPNTFGPTLHAQQIPQAPPSQARPPIVYGTAPVRTVAPPTAAAPIKVLAPAPTATPVMYYPPPFYPSNAYPAARRTLRDVSFGEWIVLGTQVLTALRSLPTAPTDKGDANTNIVNGVAFLDAVAKHFKSSVQLNALGNLAGRLVG